MTRPEDTCDNHAEDIAPAFSIQCLVQSKIHAIYSSLLCPQSQSLFGYHKIRGLQMKNNRSS